MRTRDIERLAEAIAAKAKVRSRTARAADARRRARMDDAVAEARERAAEVEQELDHCRYALDKLAEMVGYEVPKDVPRRQWAHALIAAVPPWAADMKADIDALRLCLGDRDLDLKAAAKALGWSEARVEAAADAAGILVHVETKPKRRKP